MNEQMPGIITYLEKGNISQPMSMETSRGKWERMKSAGLEENPDQEWSLTEMVVIELKA